MLKWVCTETEGVGLPMQNCSKLGDLVCVKVGLHGNRGKEFADAELFRAW